MICRLCRQVQVDQGWVLVLVGLTNTNCWFGNSLTNTPVQHQPTPTVANTVANTIANAATYSANARLARSQLEGGLVLSTGKFQWGKTIFRGNENHLPPERICVQGGTIFIQQGETRQILFKERQFLFRERRIENHLWGERRLSFFPKIHLSPLKLGNLPGNNTHNMHY